MLGAARVIKSARCTAFALGLFLVPRALFAACETPVSHLPAVAQHLTTASSVAQLGGAFVAPFVLAPTGVDAATRTFIQRDLRGRYAAEATSVYAGYLLPVAAGSAWVLSALVGCNTNRESTRITAAVTQATLLAALTSGALKFAIGRGYPTGGGDPYAANRLDDPSRALRFHPGDFGAFPSGHAATSFAFAAALRASMPTRGAVRFLGYPLALAISYGMLHGDHHWLSDTVSGALLGEAIGSAVGSSFVPGRDTRAFYIYPQRTGVVVGGSF